MPAIPIADKRPPMVGGMRQTSNEMRTRTDGGAGEQKAVGGNHGSGDAEAEVAGAEVGAGDLFGGAVASVTNGGRFGLGAAEGVGLGLAAAFGHGFGEVGEEHGEPQPEGDLEVEAESGLA